MALWHGALLVLAKFLKKSSEDTSQRLICILSLLEEINLPTLAVFFTHVPRLHLDSLTGIGKQWRQAPTKNGGRAADGMTV